jgi:tetratricopeptide (TPR) repeat protein
MIDCTCGFGKNIPEDQAACPVCGADVTPLHRIRRLPRHYYNEGVDAANDGRLDVAIECLSTAVSLDDSYGAAHKSLGDTYVKRAMYGEAGRHYGKALQFEPDDETLRQSRQDAEMAFSRQAAGNDLAESRKVGVYWKTLAVFTLLAFLLGLAVLPTINLLTRENRSVPIDYAQLTGKVKQSLAAEPVLRGMSIDVAQAGGSLRVSGDVPTEVHKRLVSELAKTAVANQIPLVLNVGVAVNRPEQPVLHTVRPGDSLSSLAVTEYGNGRSWTKIYAANRNKLSSPNGLKVGQVLVIPK